MAVATPLLALVRGLIGFLTLETSPIAADDADVYANFICDDGGPLHDQKGRYREECTHEGCGFTDDVCYFGGYFDRCLDDYGRPNGQCETTETPCNGILGCLSLWIDCDGEYTCVVPASVGCKQGKCVEE